MNSGLHAKAAYIHLHIIYIYIIHKHIRIQPHIPMFIYV